METDWATALTNWTARVAVACYLARILVDAGFGRSSRVVARTFWTAGCLVLVVHVLCALNFVHDWSHTAAMRHTAAQTEQVVGLRWGGGLYVNYVFAAVWMADTIGWWWRGPDSAYHPRIRFWVLHAFFAFIVFNATVVFGPRYWKWIAVAVAALLAALFSRRMKDRPTSDAP